MRKFALKKDDLSVLLPVYKLPAFSLHMIPTYLCILVPAHDKNQGYFSAIAYA